MRALAITESELQRLADLASTAQAILNEADLSEDALRPAGFGILLEYLLKSATALAEHTPGPADQSVERDSLTNGESGFIAKVVHETGAKAESLAQLFYLEGGEPRIAVPSRKLGASMREQQIRVAYLIVGARFFGLNETDVPFEVVRGELARLKCLDSKNFATYMRDLTGVVVVGDKSKFLRARPALLHPFLDEVNDLVALANNGV